MPKAYMCLICRDLYEGEPFYEFDTDLVEEDCDFCEECTHKLKAFLKGAEATNLSDYEEAKEE